MSEASTDLLRQALLQIRELKARLQASEAARPAATSAEPIAIIGAGVRLPGGVVDMAGFADLLWNGTDPVREVPPERWSLEALHDADPDVAGRMTTRFGAFLDGLDRFDADFFGVSPREAASLDPQQRLLLETSWEALEQARIAPPTLNGSRTGVYLGLGNADYGRELMAAAGRLDAYASTGTAFSTAAGRLSYFYGLQGPSMAIDTACSASLVALHLAVQALRQRECDLALVGGVNLILAPEHSIVFSKARMLAPDGRCKTFSADADGYGRGEGCVVFVLRRLDEAERRGERVLGLIRGTATNQDGRSAGLTAPNGLAQEAVIGAALQAGGVDPLAISYVEAHGTGTPLGDPIEVGAIGRALCAGRAAAAPLVIGSVKSNIGHLEAAAGLAGLAKLLIAFEREEIPANLHFADGNPEIDWQLPVTVPATPLPWRADTTRIAGLSAFGFGGSNAHAVIEAPRVAAPTPAADVRDRPVHILPLSARDAPTLMALAARYRVVLAGASVGDVCHGAAAGRAHFAYRLAVVGADAAELAQALEAAIAGPVRMSAPPVCFVVPPLAANEAPAIAALAASEPVFAAAFDTALAGLGEDGDEARGLALRVGVAALWRSWGLGGATFVGAPGAEPVAALLRGERGGAEVLAALHGGARDDPRADAADPQAVRVPLLGEGGKIWRALLATLRTLYVAGATIDWAAFDRAHPRGYAPLPTYPFRRVRHWAPQVRAYAMPAFDDPADPRPLTQRLTTVPPQARRQLVIELLRGGFAALARQQGTAAPGIDARFGESGIDVRSATLRARIEEMAGVALPPTLLMNQRTISELADYLLARVAAAKPAAMPSAVPEPQARAAADVSDADVAAVLAARLAKLR